MKTNQTSILLVDDEPMTNFVAQKFLENHFHVKCATSGYEALAVLKHTHFDIVLQDINLGDEAMDGIKVMRLIKSDKSLKRTKVIAVTAYSAARDWYMAEGFDEFFMKPVVREGIFPLLEKMMAGTKEQPLRFARHSAPVAEVMETAEMAIL